MHFRTIKRGFRYVKRTRDFQSVFDYLGMINNLSKMLNVNKSVISSMISELNETGLIEYIDKKLGSSGNPTGALLNPAGIRILYCTVRTIKPKVMIETGVSSGSSTSIILTAMQKNKIGKLISIDLNPSSKDSDEWIPETKESGWIIPQELRNRWELHNGKSLDLLKPILAEFDQIDIFFHDSDHSYENMNFEFETSYPKLKRGGVILSDNASNINSAFSNFASSKTKKWKVISDFGIMVKS